MVFHTLRRAARIVRGLFVRRARCLSCVSLDSSSGMTWSLPLAESNAWSVWKVSADLAGTVFPVWEEEVPVSEVGLGTWFSSDFISNAHLEGPEWSQREVHDPGSQEQLCGGPGPGKQEGRMEMVAKRRSPRATLNPVTGAVGPGEPARGPRLQIRKGYLF